ncbi:MAG TPA: divergent polysaccharide deacetylase family protein, partial [bacterium]|nr:divergent polysaccharide deacetylase family protein [bacterium]
TARRHGQAVAIGHPYPETVQVLRRELTGPALQGVELVPLSSLVPANLVQSSLAQPSEPRPGLSRR